MVGRMTSRASIPGMLLSGVAVHKKREREIWGFDLSRGSFYINARLCGGFACTTRLVSECVCSMMAAASRGRGSGV